MPRSAYCLILAIALWASAGLAQDDFRPLFNGKDLTGWAGHPELWTVEQGQIVGRTTGAETLTANQFLIWQGGAVKNFELRVKIQLTGNNSGIQYRSRLLTQNGPWSVAGYQLDVHPAALNQGMLYEERGRGILSQNGQGVVVDPEGFRWLASEHDPVQVDAAAWREYSILAQGNHLIHRIDGQMTMELHDFELAKRSLEGVLAFQLHRGPAMTVRIKDVLFKELAEGGVIDFEVFPIPSDAQIIERGAPAVHAKAKATAR
jgi:hypothetical protein